MGLLMYLLDDSLCSLDSKVFSELCGRNFPTLRMGKEFNRAPDVMCNF